MESCSTPSVRPRQATQYPHETGKKKILLVDDVKLFIELQKTFFQRKEAFEVLTASNGKDALAIVETEKPDLIYLDLYMPEMNGDECCRLIKGSDQGRDIPVIMVTSAGEKADRELCEAAGCDEIVTKPINRGHFMSIAKKYLEVHERKEPRYAVHVKVRFGEDRSMVLSDYTVNLNTGGLFLTSPKNLPVGTSLHLEFSLPETGISVSCQARVAWVNDAENPDKIDLPAGMGLQFIDITSSEVAIIEAYVEKNGLAPDW